MQLCYIFPFITLLLVYFFFQENYFSISELEKDANNCINSFYETCEEVNIKTPGYICCQINEETDYSIKQTCELKTTKEEQDKLVDSSLLLNKELRGIQIFNEKYGGIVGEKLKREITINCYIWDLFVKQINNNDYSQKEISILKSENHCLTYFTSFLNPTDEIKREVTKEICFRALLLYHVAIWKLKLKNLIHLKELKHVFFMIQILLKLVF